MHRSQCHSDHQKSWNQHLAPDGRKWWQSHHTIPSLFLRDLEVISNVKQLMSLKFFETGCSGLELGPPLRMLLKKKRGKDFLLAATDKPWKNDEKMAEPNWESQGIKKKCQITHWNSLPIHSWIHLVSIFAFVLTQTIQLRVINAISHRPAYGDPALISPLGSFTFAILMFGSVSKWSPSYIKCLNTCSVLIYAYICR